MRFAFALLLFSSSVAFGYDGPPNGTIDPQMITCVYETTAAARKYAINDISIAAQEFDHDYKLVSADLMDIFPGGKLRWSYSFSNKKRWITVEVDSYHSNSCDVRWVKSDE